jgi:hypothetical protein
MDRKYVIKLGRIAIHVVKGSAELVDATAFQLGQDLLDELERAGFVFVSPRLTVEPHDQFAKARELKQAGHVAGVHPELGIVVYLNGIVWCVVGGNVESPTLQRRGDVPRDSVQWL